MLDSKINISNSLAEQLKLDALNSLINKGESRITLEAMQVVETKPEFTGDYSLVVFGLAKIIGGKPEDIANELGVSMLADYPNRYTGFEVIKGFLNFSISDTVLMGIVHGAEKVGALPMAKDAAKIMVEYSSPNTNKPLHFGHLRNIFLGASVSEILQFVGHEVVKANLLNDRGIHICKSMQAWIDDGANATPESTNKKGDHLVGDYYVAFENKMKEEAKELFAELKSGNMADIEGTQLENAQKLLVLLEETTDKAEKQVEISAKLMDIAKYNTNSMRATRKLLLDWEANEPSTYAIWEKLNSWVLAGFDKTYKKLGVSFDAYYYESKTYLLGKKLVEDACAKGILQRKEDNSIWIDLRAEGYDEKLLLRGDGTSVYMTQDIGTSKLKYDDYAMDKSIFVIADEQNYHMQVLQKTLEKMQEPCAKGIHHLSYGLVELPSGRMKTREGNVVDADDMVAEMVSIAAKHTQELGKIDDFTDAELEALYNKIGLGALKFYLLRVDPKKKMIFNPEESIDFHGFTGPFVQYTYARIHSILSKENSVFIVLENNEPLLTLERKMILLLEQFYPTAQTAASELNPSIICNYVFGVAKTFNGLIAELKILKAESEEKKQLRINICVITQQVIGNCLKLLGIETAEKM